MRSRYKPIRMLAGVLCLVMLLCTVLPAGAGAVSDLEEGITEQEKKEQEARAAVNNTAVKAFMKIDFFIVSLRYDLMYCPVQV